jgi:HTH-type transcriptional regulator, sugar sensing transcriptional regulator
MIVEERFINKLKEFGLNSYEVKLWVALLSRGVSTAGELSDIANVPRSRTYDVLESLEKKGFIIMKIGKPIKYLAVEPDHVVENLKKQIARDAQERAKDMETLKSSDLLTELKFLHTHGIEHIDSTELSGSVKGRQNVYSQIESAIAGAQKTVTIMTTSSGFLRKVDGLKSLFEKLHKRGVKVRIAAPLNEECKKMAKVLEGIVEVRHTEKAGRFVLVDGEQLVFMILDDAQVHPTYDVGIWVNTPFFTQALEGLFELAWKEMKEVKALKH